MGARLLTLGQQVFFPPSLTRGMTPNTDEGIRFIQSEYCEVDFGRKHHSSLGVSSGERRDKVIKILRPMKASGFNL